MNFPCEVACSLSGLQRGSTGAASAPVREVLEGSCSGGARLQVPPKSGMHTSAASPVAPGPPRASQRCTRPSFPPQASQRLQSWAEGPWDLTPNRVPEHGARTTIRRAQRRKTRKTLCTFIAVRAQALLCALPPGPGLPGARMPLPLSLPRPLPAPLPALPPGPARAALCKL